MGTSERLVSFLLRVIDRSVTVMDRLTALLLRAISGLLTAIDRLVTLIAHAAAGTRGKDHKVTQHARASGSTTVYQIGSIVITRDGPMTTYGPLPPYGDIRDAAWNGNSKAMMTPNSWRTRSVTCPRKTNSSSPSERLTRSTTRWRGCSCGSAPRPRAQTETSLPCRAAAGDQHCEH